MMTSWIMPQALGYFWQGSGSWAYLLPTAGLHWAGPHLGALSESPVAPDEVKNALRPVLMAVSSSRLIKMPIYHFQPGLIGFRVPAFRARAPRFPNWMCPFFWSPSQSLCEPTRYRAPNQPSPGLQRTAGPRKRIWARPKHARHIPHAINAH